jgi:probable HAF family extracellular repeat protein
LGIRNNENGDVAGECFNGTSIMAFLYSNGSYTELLPPDWSWATAYGINDHGDVAGWGADSTGTEKGFIYSDGSYFELLPPGWVSATAYGINNNGEVVGEGVDSSGKGKGYIYSSGTYTELSPPGWNDVVPEDINDNGDVAGYGKNGTVTSGFVYKNGVFIEITSPDKSNSEIIGINNNAELAGKAYNDNYAGQTVKTHIMLQGTEILSRSMRLFSQRNLISALINPSSSRAVLTAIIQKLQAEQY